MQQRSVRRRRLSGDEWAASYGRCDKAAGVAEQTAMEACTSSCMCSSKRNVTRLQRKQRQRLRAVAVRVREQASGGGRAAAAGAPPDHADNSGT